MLGAGDSGLYSDGVRGVTDTLNSLISAGICGMHPYTEQVQLAEIR